MPIFNNRHNLYDRFFRILTEMLNSQQVINRNIQTLYQIQRENVIEHTNLNYEVLDVMREYISLERDNDIIQTLRQDHSPENREFLRNLLSRSESERIRRHYHEEQLSQHSFSNINSLYSQSHIQPQTQRTTRQNTSQQNTREQINRNGGLNFFDLIQRSLERTERNRGLTSNEIDSNCTSFLYQDISSNITRCPIGLHDFEPQERILQINHCGHIFNEQHLRRVFSRDSRCPMCRHNLRETTPQQPIARPPPQPIARPPPQTTNTETNMGNIFSSIFSNSTTIPTNNNTRPRNNAETLAASVPVFRNRRDPSGNLISMEASFFTNEPTEFFRNLQENLNNQTTITAPPRNPPRNPSRNENNNDEFL
jgi:hypothetical protein